MNIFYLDVSPITAVEYMSNKHIVKMIIESAQLLSTAHHILDGKTEIEGVELYKPTHKNHPSAVWVRESEWHYDWLYRHFVELCHEYTARYGKIHKTEEKLKRVLRFKPSNIPSKRFESPPQCLPSQYKTKLTTKAYLHYYANEKLFTHEDKLRFMKALKKTKIYIQDHTYASSWRRKLLKRLQLEKTPTN